MCVGGEGSFFLLTLLNKFKPEPNLGLQKVNQSRKLLRTDPSWDSAQSKGRYLSWNILATDRGCVEGLWPGALVELLRAFSTNPPSPTENNRSSVRPLYKRHQRRCRKYYTSLYQRRDNKPFTSDDSRNRGPRMLISHAVKSHTRDQAKNRHAHALTQTVLLPGDPEPPEALTRERCPQARGND